MKDFLFDFYFFKKLINTNNELKKINKYLKKKKNIALFTVEQTKGRGRVDRKWISTIGDLTCSYLINKDFEVNEIGKINIWFSLTLLSLLKTKFPKKEFKIKWPNDIYLEDKKLAGILIETNIKKNKIRNLIIGLGINFVSSPMNFKYKTISINSFADKENPINFFIHLTKELNDSLKSFKKTICKTDISFLKNFKDYGKLININRNGKIVDGVFSGIGNNGEIILKKNDNYFSINYGEII